jgi:periplasmic divalent cation tolerance protein
MDLTGFCVVQTTTDSAELAESIAAALLAAKLAACVQIAEAQSRYIWRGEQARAAEFVLSIKARTADFADIAAKIRALHVYELPEVIALPILAGDAAYLDWVRQETERA